VRDQCLGTIPGGVLLEEEEEEETSEVDEEKEVDWRQKEKN